MASDLRFSTYHPDRAWPKAWAGGSDHASARMQVIDLEAHFNNVAFAAEPELANGRLNIWQNSYPLAQAQLLPRDLDVGGLRFRWHRPNGRDPDNIRCNGQWITVPPQRYDWVYILASAERRVKDELALVFADGSVDFVEFEIADFWPGATSKAGAREAIRFEALNFPRHVQRAIEPGIWRHRIAVAREAVLSQIRLPDHVAAHIFCMTCLIAEDFTS
jgi:hypothetical protein